MHFSKRFILDFKGIQINLIDTISFKFYEFLYKIHKERTK